MTEDKKEILTHLSKKAKDDYILIEKALNNNDQTAYAKLYYSYRYGVYVKVFEIVKCSIEAECQTVVTFQKAFSKLNSYEPTYAFSTWLYTIAKNNAIDFKRRKRVAVTSLDGGFKNENGDTISFDACFLGKNPEQELIKAQRNQFIRDIVGELSPNYQTIIQLCYFDELSYNEISQKLKLPLNTVKARLRRGRICLEQIMVNKRFVF